MSTNLTPEDDARKSVSWSLPASSKHSSSGSNSFRHFPLLSNPNEIPETYNISAPDYTLKPLDASLYSSTNSTPKGSTQISRNETKSHNEVPQNSGYIPTNMNTYQTSNVHRYEPKQPWSLDFTEISKYSKPTDIAPLQDYLGRSLINIPQSEGLNQKENTQPLRKSEVPISKNEADEFVKSIMKKYNIKSSRPSLDNSTQTHSDNLSLPTNSPNQSNFSRINIEGVRYNGLAESSDNFSTINTTEFMCSNKENMHSKVIIVDDLKGDTERKVLGENLIGRNVPVMQANSFQFTNPIVEKFSSENLPLYDKRRAPLGDKTDSLNVMEAQKYEKSQSFDYDNTPKENKKPKFLQEKNTDFKERGETKELTFERKMNPNEKVKVLYRGEEEEEDLKPVAGTDEQKAEEDKTFGYPEKIYLEQKQIINDSNNITNFEKQESVGVFSPMTLESVSGHKFEKEQNEIYSDNYAPAPEPFEPQRFDFEMMVMGKEEFHKREVVQTDPSYEKIILGKGLDDQIKQEIKENKEIQTNSNEEQKNQKSEKLIEKKLGNRLQAYAVIFSIVMLLLLWLYMIIST